MVTYAGIQNDVIMRLSGVGEPRDFSQLIREDTSQTVTSDQSAAAMSIFNFPLSPGGVGYGFFP